MHKGGGGGGGNYERKRMGDERSRNLYALLPVTYATDIYVPFYSLKEIYIYKFVIILIKILYIFKDITQFLISSQTSTLMMYLNLCDIRMSKNV